MQLNSSENENFDFSPVQEEQEYGFEPNEGPQLAGFNDRFLAYVIDAAPFLFAHSLTISFLKNAGNPPASITPILLGWLFLYFIYLTVMSSGGRVTLGKYIMGLRIVGKDGNPLPLSKSLIRAIGYFISGAPLSLGFIIAAFTPEKKALHDYMCGSTVISIKERGDLAQGLIMAVSWALMITLGYSALYNNVLKLSPREKIQIRAAHVTVEKISILEEYYKQRNGGYTNDLQELAKLLGSSKNISNMKKELGKNLEGPIVIEMPTASSYVIRAKAKNWRHTEVVSSSEDRQQKQARRKARR